jgi:excisionase family DNA binding protein
MLAMADKLDKPLYTITEAAKLLTVSGDTIRRMIKAGELDAIKVRGTWRIRRESLEKYLKP